ncbi:hypothetical protein JIN84_16705 [Luteolibacter yonseiensis]|uniref:Uncharacterized protein n=2 Tax=Luteolibacter yonseiensis TaxID=1144680 RepID=A0A934R2M2_9BACT|nr:hypothetical protein [Luteolibacter yonseiensis]MBK1817263.1 hypothetical protein [Luteolibacter yonseiensis]
MKIIAMAVGVLFMIALGRAFFVPLLELSSRYCFHCGESHAVARILGIPVWQSKVDDFYRDGVPVPPHPHRMIESNRSSYSLLHGMEHRDEFGATGRGAREALVEGWRGSPGQRREVVRRFMELEPREDDRMENFIRTYGRGTGAEAVPSSGGLRMPE